MKTKAPIVPLTQMEVSRRIGVNFTTVCRYANGSRMPSMPVLMKIFKEFDVSPDEQERLMTAINRKKTLDQRRKVFGKWMETNVFAAPKVS